jgi:hypothetical protein
MEIDVMGCMEIDVIICFLCLLGGDGRCGAVYFLPTSRLTSNEISSFE